MLISDKNVCKVCGRPKVAKRRFCVEHAKQDALKRAKASLERRGRTRYTHTCLACKVSFDNTQKQSRLCDKCRKEQRVKRCASNNYVYEWSSVDRHIWQHRRIAETCLNRPLSTNEVVHHVDDIPTNNALTNLIVMSRSLHGKLHYYLDEQRVIFEKSKNENSENCWETLIVPMTTAWLEMTGAKVIKLSEIGQSAAELLNSHGYEEGSETRHGTP